MNVGWPSMRPPPRPRPCGQKARDGLNAAPATYGSHAHAAGRHLEFCLVARKRRSEGNVERKGEVHQAQPDDDGVAHQLDLADVALRHEHRRDLLPAQAAMRHEDEDREGVKEGPDGIPEDLEFKRVDVAHTHLGDARVLAPEEVQCGDAPEVDEERGWADVVGAKLLGVAETELEEVNGHEGHEHEAGDG